MKMVIRADDVGYTHTHNLGTFQAVDHGVVTSCDVMLDTPGTVEALELLRDRPWISTGWHTHFWGSPVLNPADVPTLYDAATGHFRQDLARAEDVSYDEILAEMRAQMDRCVKIMGRALDVGGGGRGDSPFSRAMAQIVKEYGLVTNFSYNADWAKMFGEGVVEYTINPDPKWADRKIYFTVNVPGTSCSKVLRTDSIAEQRSYQPIRMWTENESGLMTNVPEDGTAVVILHPGYIDYYVCRLGDQGPRAWDFLTTRPLEVQAICSDELKNWVKAHNIEMVNFRDALYGTQDYQNHLRQIGSDLCVR